MLLPRVSGKSAQRQPLGCSLRAGRAGGTPVPALSGESMAPNACAITMPVWRSQREKVTAVEQVTAVPAVRASQRADTSRIGRRCASRARPGYRRTLVEPELVDPRGESRGVRPLQGFEVG